jgi:hypothetical protein
MKKRKNRVGKPRKGKKKRKGKKERSKRRKKFTFQEISINLSPVQFRQSLLRSLFWKEEEQNMSQKKKKTEQIKRENKKSWSQKNRSKTETYSRTSLVSNWIKPKLCFSL